MIQTISRSNRASPVPYDKIQNQNRSSTVRGSYLPSLFQSVSPFRDDDRQTTQILVPSRNNQQKNIKEKDINLSTLKRSNCLKGCQCQNQYTQKAKQNWGYKDLEQVQQELIMLKQQYNQVKDENRQLQTRLRVWEISLIDTINDESLLNNPQLDIQKLHYQMAQLMSVYKKLQEKNSLDQRQLSDAREEIAYLKNNSRVSRYEQLEVELRRANEECQRLLNITNILINTKSEVKIEFQSSKDIQDFPVSKICDAQDLLLILNQEMKRSDEEKAQYDKKIFSLNKRLLQLKYVLKQTQQQKNTLQIKVDELQFLQKEIITQPTQIQKKRKESQNYDSSQIIQDQQIQLHKLQQEINTLKEANNRLEQQQIEQYRNNSLQNSLQLPQENKVAKIKDQLILDHEFNKFLLNKQQKQSLEEQISRSETPQKIIQVETNIPQEQETNGGLVTLKRQKTDLSIEQVVQPQLGPKNSNKEEDLEQSLENELKNSVSQRLFSRFQEDNETLKELQNSRLPKVTTSNLIQRDLEMNQTTTTSVNQIVKELKNKFMIAGIEYGKLDQLFSIDKYEELSIKQLFNMFEKEPFMMIASEDRINLARYLVEDNTQNYIVFNQDETANINIIKSVFKKLIGPYKLFDENEQNQVQMELATNLNKVSLQFDTSIAMLTSDKNIYKKNECELQDFYQALKLFDITLSLRQNDYLNLLIFKQNQSLGRFNYRKLLDNLKEVYNENNQNKADIVNKSQQF